MRIDIHTSYRFKCMLSWLYIFAIMPIISVVLFIFSKWYLIAALLILIYFFIGVIAFCIGNRISKQLLYQYIILDNEYFEIEDKYGNYLKFEKKCYIFPKRIRFHSFLMSLAMLRVSVIIGVLLTVIFQYKMDLKK